MFTNVVQVHHLVTYFCPEYLGSSDDNTDVNGVCDEWDTNMPATECRGGYINYAWAIGGNELYFPQQAGLPMSGDSDFHWMILGMYDYGCFAYILQTEKTHEICNKYDNA